MNPIEQATTTAGKLILEQVRAQLDHAEITGFQCKGPNSLFSSQYTIDLQIPGTGLTATIMLYQAPTGIESKQSEGGL